MDTLSARVLRSAFRRFYANILFLLKQHPRYAAAVERRINGKEWFRYCHTSNKDFCSVLFVFIQVLQLIGSKILIFKVARFTLPLNCVVNAIMTKEPIRYDDKTRRNLRVFIYFNIN